MEPLLSFAGWDTALDPKQFSLLSILKFRKTKEDFTFNKCVEHTEIDKFVFQIANTTKDKRWNDAASLLYKNRLLKASILVSVYYTKYLMVGHCQNT